MVEGPESCGKAGFIVTMSEQIQIITCWWLNEIFGT
jgi:hypothetical protein